MVVPPWKSGYRLGGTMEFSGYDTGTGKIVSDMILEKKPDISAAPYSIGRFGTYS